MAPVLVGRYYTERQYNKVALDLLGRESQFPTSLSVKRENPVALRSGMAVQSPR